MFMGYSLHFCSHSPSYPSPPPFSLLVCLFAPPPPSDSQSPRTLHTTIGPLPSQSFIVSIRTSLCLFLNCIFLRALFADPSSCHVHSL
ncbi:hypothetical protein CORC01_02088 [Colletotrichum orchidophilum]|uniref:Uncharacterized protein n=1 Tax=Colletotrichum orchidophilum TaxID=1209926 RepID=A0A1G4BMK3_9PEZI|nr:uncharacterized protein CORC01_02088 [Colletotrichum orchidophilum]OHF02692.1 hypothetical protein CORC01_02088 [Colletotrichum orchidophilum]